MNKLNRTQWSVAFNAALAAIAMTGAPAWSQALPPVGLPQSGVPARDANAVNVPPLVAPVNAGTVSSDVVTVSGFRFMGNTSIPNSELQTVVASGLNQTLGLAQLDNLANAVSRYYRSKGFTVARAYLPPQQTSDGVIQIAVIEGQYGAINLTNSTDVSSDKLKLMLASNLCGATAATPASCGGIVVQDKALERSILLIKDLPGVTATVNLKPGANIGSSDLDVNVKPTKAVAYSLGADNYGAASTGKIRLNAAADFNNLAGMGDQLSLSAATTSGKGANTGGVSYTLPIGSDGVRAGLAFARSQYRLGAGFESTLSHGTSNALTAFASYPVIRGVNNSLYLRGSAEARKMYDSIDSTSTYYQKSANVFRLGMNGDNIDAIGGGGYTAYGLTVSSGKITTNDASDAAGANTAGQFTKLSYNIARQQALSGPVTLYGSLVGQKAGSRNLDGSEQIGIGGPTAVRAYGGEAGGSTGAVATAELRYTMPVALGASPANVTYGLFTDRGWVQVYQNPINGTTNLNGTGSNTRALGGYGLSVTLQSQFAVQTPTSSSYFVRAMYAAHPSAQVGTPAYSLSNPGSNSQFWLQGGYNF